MKTVTLLLTLVLAAHKAQAKIEAVIGDVPLKQNANVLGLPSTPTDEVIISRKQYVISYNKERRSPNWVAWKVDAKSLGAADRTDKFQQDKELQEYLSQDPQTPPAVTPNDYSGSCFDRGHQVPSADRTNSTSSNQATFVMSNMLPQTPYVNRVLWEDLEQHTRKLVAEGNTVYVIAGPVYDQNFGEIGPNNDIPVPSKLFKVLIVEKEKKRSSFAVMMPNVLKSGEEPTDKKSLCNDVATTSGAHVKDWREYKSSVSEIQNVTGIRLKQ
ncbi:DNA/RNA non-specific endonuclease [Bdellovibrio sp. HCB337]|uniref:DNA/RNA non-specific endonuclease n=1 Tax=Bdellovibrio sp. HCB337 TaxID=3394358 RepID=UPI0039A58700